ncbi:hypothetical protein MMC06_002600 [Schaereria dolodes]|nr:hypothetical protein [Schaereria dolodes]
MSERSSKPASSPVAAINPALLSITPTAPSTPASSPLLFHTPDPVPLSTQSAVQSPRRKSSHEALEARTRSQPLEQYSSPVSPVPRPINPRRPRHPYPPAQFCQLRERNQSILHHPYSRPTQQRVVRSSAPTSAPVQNIQSSNPGIPHSSPHDDSYKFNLHHDQTTLALGILTNLAQMIKACEDMRTFIQRGFSEGDMGGDDLKRTQVENHRLRVRQTNRLATELDEELILLPNHDHVADLVPYPIRIPKTGREIQTLDREHPHPRPNPHLPSPSTVRLID